MKHEDDGCWYCNRDVDEVKIKVKQAWTGPEGSRRYSQI